MIAAPNRDSNINSKLVIQFPGIHGKMENFAVYNASIMEPVFAANHPEIQLYVAVSKENTGTVNEVAIELCTTTQTIVLSNEEFTLTNFSLYPNPNKGEFSLSFNSQSGKAIDIYVYDIAGRLVHAKNYNATATFNENISLHNVSSGMYLLTVTGQERTITKKLIIE